MKTLCFPSELLRKNEITDIVLDTTGLKIYEVGEWRAKKYKSRRRSKKLHLGMDPHSEKLVFAKITDEYVYDTAYPEEALQKINRRKGKLLFHGIADSKQCYERAQRHNIS